MIRDDKNIYYRNVHIFIERVLDLITIKNQKFVKINLNICLKKNALMWYIVELSMLKRSIFRQINFNENWIIMFCKRFKFNQSTIINVLIIERYFISNVRNNRKSINYVQQMINYAKNVNFDSTFHQIIWIWRNLDFELKRNIFAFIKHTTLFQFLQLIKNKKKIWQKMYRNRHLDQVN